MLIKSAIFLLALFAAGWLAQFSAENPGFVSIWWFGYEIKTSVTFVLICLATISALFFFGGQLWSFIKNAPFIYERWRKNKQQADGMDKLYLALEALSLGENDTAVKYADKATKLLADKRLGEIVSIEAGKSIEDAEFAGQLQLEHKSKDNNFITNKAMLNAAVAEQDWEKALKFSERLYTYKPKNGWVLNNLFEVKLHNGLYEEALNMLSQVRRYGNYSAESLDFQAACMHMKLAEQLNADKQFKKALKQIDKGLKNIPTFAPLALLQKSILLHIGKYSLCEKLLGKFWQKCPNLSLFEQWLDIVESKTPSALVNKAENLAKSHMDQASGNIACALANIRTKNWKQAREYLIQSVKIEPNSTSYKMLTEIEEAVAPNTKAGYTWLHKAIEAPALNNTVEDFTLEYEIWCESYNKAIKNEIEQVAIEAQ